MTSRTPPGTRGYREGGGGLACGAVGLACGASNPHPEWPWRPAWRVGAGVANIVGGQWVGMWVE